MSVYIQNEIANFGRAGNWLLEQDVEFETRKCYKGELDDEDVIILEGRSPFTGAHVGWAIVKDLSTEMRLAYRLMDGQTVDLVEDGGCLFIIEEILPDALEIEDIPLKGPTGGLLNRYVRIEEPNAQIEETVIEEDDQIPF